MQDIAVPIGSTPPKWTLPHPMVTSQAEFGRPVLPNLDQSEAPITFWLITPEPLDLAKFRADFWPLQGPQNQTVTIPMTISHPKFRRLYANEFRSNSNLPPNQLLR